MPSPTPFFRRTALLATVVAALAACGGNSHQSASSVAANADAASHAGIPAGTVLNFGDQQQLFQTLMKESGALTNLPYKVNFVEFNSGPLVDAGLAAKKIDAGFMGDLPATLAVKSGIQAKAIGVAQPVGASEYLLAKPGITSIAQLKGKRVAYTTGTAEQAFALRALATVHLSQRDVHQVNVALLQLGTVLESGAADASVVSVAQKVNYEQHHAGSHVLATIDTVKPASYLYVLGASAALHNPAKNAAAADFTKRLITATTWQKTHSTEWVQTYYVDLQDQTPAAAKLILAAGGTFTFVPITASVQSALQNVVDLLAGAGALTSGYSVAPLFDNTESQHYNDILQKGT
jgi:sulfonate transport system substrate-binding protein